MIGAESQRGEPGSVPRRERRAIDGVILIDKPLQMTSAQVVARVKRAVQCEKIGHAGTLDPDASGLLVCLLGRATKLASHAEGGTKVYSGTVRLGLTTSTDDTSGEVLRELPVSAAEADIAAAAARFRGDIEQVPPAVSALKIGGERAYKLVRAGITPEMKSRRVVIFNLVVSNWNGTTFDFECTCSKGTYIRALARDIGAALGCGGALASLRREASAPFAVSNALSLDGNLEAGILPWHSLLPNAPRIELSMPEAIAVWNGVVQPLKGLSRAGSDGQLALYQAAGCLPSGVLTWTEAGWRILANVTAPDGVVNQSA